MDRNDRGQPSRGERNNLIPFVENVTKIGKLGVVYILGIIIPHVLTVLVLPIFTHYLPPAQYGIVTLARQIWSPLSILIALGLLSAVASHYFRMEEARRPQLVKTVLIGLVIQMGLLCSVLSLAGIWVAEYLLPNLPLSPGLVLALWVMIVWTCFFSCLVLFGVTLTQLHERAVVSVSINLLNYLLQIILGIFAVVYLGWQGFGRQGTLLMGAIGASVFSFFVIWRFASGKFDFSLFKRILRTGLGFVPHSFSGMLAITVNAWLVNKLVSTAALGVYGIAVLFGQLIQLPLNAFGSAAYPTLAKLMSDGGTEARRQHSRLYTLLIAGISALALAVSLFAPVAIKILTAPGYHEAMRVVPILVFAWLIHGLYWVASNPVFYFGGGLWMATATISSVVVSIILNIILAPIYGLYGAAMAMVGCFFVRFVVITIVSHRLYPLPWQVGAIARAIGCAVLLELVDIWLSPQLPLIPAIVLKAVMLLAMIPLMWICGVVSTGEVAKAKDLIIARIRSSGR
ncbi:MAG: polysaccharide biosynthesis protein [Planctomycetota bacterium]|nr:MAG: polysaccharide biosynthesis protein [Planctomycetota bacterium]